MSSAYGNESRSSGSVRRFKKTDRCRRSWSLQEEQVLITALKEIVAQGLRSDNGFKAGYLKRLELAMQQVFPNTDIKGTPHILSKMTTWKKNYNALAAILSRSGVGFNSSHMIECEDDAWEMILEADEHAKMMRYKSWPYYEDWMEIFGKDRATGDLAEDMLDALNEMGSEGYTAASDTNTDYRVNLEDFVANEGADETASEVPAMHGPARNIGKKRRPTDEATPLGEILGEIGRKTGKRLAQLAARIGYEFDVTKARKEAFDILDQIAGLSLDDKFDVCDLLAKETEKLDIFMGLRDDKRAPYVMRIIKHLGK